MAFKVFFIGTLFLAFVVGPGGGGSAAALELKSPAFENLGTIPAKYTCEGADVSPSLSWDDPPEGTKSFCLFCEDPDAPQTIWLHWAIYDIPSDARGLPEGIPREHRLDNGSKQVENDFGNIGYGGPCPPPGTTHRYFFELYALDTKLDLARGATKRQLEDTMEGHTLAFAKLVGLYGR